MVFTKTVCIRKYLQIYDLPIEVLHLRGKQKIYMPLNIFLREKNMMYTDY